MGYLCNNQWATQGQLRDYLGKHVGVYQGYEILKDYLKATQNLPTRLARSFLGIKRNLKII